MSSAETSKNEKAEEKTMLPLKITVEDPNTGDTAVIRPDFFVGVYTRSQEGIPEGAVGVGQIMKGHTNILEQISVAKALQEKVVPTLLDQIESNLTGKERQSAKNYTDMLSALISSLLFGSVSED